MKERSISIAVYLAVIAGIAFTGAALRESTFLCGRPECVAHFVLWAIMLVMALVTDVRQGGEAGELSMMVMLGVIAVMLSYYGSGLFVAGNLAQTPAAVLFVILCAGALVIGRSELMRGCLLTAFLICLYSMTEFPAEKYLETTRSRMLFGSELLMIAAAFVYTYRVSRFTTADSPAGRRIHSLLYPEEQEISHAALKNRCVVQIAVIASAMIVLLCAKFLYDTEAPWYYLIFFCITASAAAWHSGYRGFRYENHLIAISMLAKAVTDLSWGLGPAEHDYSGLYVLADILLFAFAAGGCRKLFEVATAAEVVLIIIAISEYYCDPVVFQFPEGQFIMLSRALLIIGTAMYAIGPWSGQALASSPEDAPAERLSSEEEVLTNEI